MIIKAVIFDLDNTLLDFIRMKERAVTAAVEAMIEAGLDVDLEESYKKSCISMNPMDGKIRRFIMTF